MNQQHTDDAPISSSSSDTPQKVPSKPIEERPEKSRISIIEKSVTHLLVATKTLLETLTKWSKLTATEGEVSDVYVRLGYEFNIACRAFNSIGVETQDLGPVPDLLRTILEETLSGEPSQAHLDKYLPRIRDIIVNLLQGLKKKQQKLRQRQTRDSNSSSQSQDARQSTSVDSNASASQDGHSRQSSRVSNPKYVNTDAQNFQPGGAYPARTASSTSDRQAQSRTSSLKPTQQPVSEEPGFSFAMPPSSLPSKDLPAPSHTSAAPPYPQNDTIPGRDPIENNHLLPPSFDSSSSFAQPRHGDAIERLQRGGELERRASRRFSAYHIQKHLGSSSGIPVIPPAQNSPIPNRGREVHESMNAARVRPGQSQAGSIRRKEAQGSPSRQKTQNENSPADVVATSTSGPLFEMPAEMPTPESPYAKTPEDKLRQTEFNFEVPKTQVATSTSAPQSTVDLPNTAARTISPPPASVNKLERGNSVNVPVRWSSRKQSESAESVEPERSTSSKELTLFLQYKTRVKKFLLPEGYDELSIARLQLAFIEKFAWNTQSNGVDLPEIYIQDPISGVRHELEDLADVKNRSVLVLNVDAVEEVKKHMDDGMGGIKSVLNEVRSAIADQQNALQRFSEKQQDANKDIARLASAPPTLSSPQATMSNGSPTSSANRGILPKHLNEVQSLRRDLANMRRNYTTWQTDMQKSIGALREKAAEIKSLPSAQPSFPSAAEVDGASSNNGRTYVNNGRKALNSTSESLMNKVEELQDTVEDLRKDVVSRGVRPLPRQLDSVSQELSTSASELKKLQAFIKREKPTWTKIWKDELQVVCDDQNLLTYQEELCTDLEADLEALEQTFSLVQEATKQQNLANPTGSTGAPGRSSSRTLNTTADPVKAKDGVLGEVRALQPNHESRLEAIERAEKMRQRELESRSDDAFKKELSGFVDEGKLKKSGGIEEAERLRKARDEATRREVWERLNGGRGVGPSPSPSPAPEAQQEASEAEKAVNGAAVPQPLEIPESKSRPESVSMSTTPDARFEDAQEAPLQF